MVPKPHISSAVKGVRRWVVLSAMLVVCACLTQMLVFGFVHYTDMRYETVQAAPPKELKVVEARRPGLSQSNGAERTESGGKTGSLLGPGGGLMDTHKNIVGGVQGEELANTKMVDPNRVKSPMDLHLARASSIASTIGAIATITLALMVFMGTVIAGGGAVPGVEKAVTASFWSIVLGLLVLPWADLMPSIAVPGVFSSYGNLTAASEAVSAAGTGGGVLFAQWLVIPFVSALCATLVGTWYHAGVNRGIIISSVSDLDRQVEREVADIAKRGLSASTPKALGALNRAIGESHERTLESLESSAGVAASLVREARTNHHHRDADEQVRDRTGPGVHPGRLI